jgi:hypothetical protein
VYVGVQLYLHLPTIYTYTNTTSSNANCHSHGFRQCHTDTQTESFSETPHDTEAAPDSAAKAGRVRIDQVAARVSRAGNSEAFREPPARPTSV